jgi:hypothetical protein
MGEDGDQSVFIPETARRDGQGAGYGFRETRRILETGAAARMLVQRAGDTVLIGHYSVPQLSHGTVFHTEGLEWVN